MRTWANHFTPDKVGRHTSFHCCLGDYGCKWSRAVRHFGGIGKGYSWCKWFPLSTWLLNIICAVDSFEATSLMLIVTHITQCDTQYVNAARDVLVFFVAQCTLIIKHRNGLWLNWMNSFENWWMWEFEPLLYILLNTLLFSCLLAAAAPQQNLVLVKRVWGFV